MQSAAKLIQNHMKNVKIIYLMAGMMALSTPQLTRAEDTKPAERPSREELREKYQKLSPEEREAKAKEIRENMEKRRGEAFKELGLNPEELKKLPEAERREKIKEAAEKKLAELRKKQADGSLTDSEKQMLGNLERREKFLKEHPGGFGERQNGKPGLKKPSDK